MNVLDFFKEYYDVEDELVASGTEELNEQIVILNNDLLMPNENFVCYPNLKVVIGNVYLNNLVSAVGIDKLEFIIGSAFFHRLKSFYGLENLKLISEDAFFDSVKNAKPIRHLDSIGGIGYFGNVRKEKYIKNIDIGTPYFPRVRKKQNHDI